VQIRSENLLAHVPKAAGSVVPVNSILLVQLNCCSEVLDGFFEVIEAVPDQSSAIKTRSVALITFKNPIVEKLEKTYSLKFSRARESLFPPIFSLIVPKWWRAEMFFYCSFMAER